MSTSGLETIIRLNHNSSREGALADNLKSRTSSCPFISLVGFFYVPVKSLVVNALNFACDR